MKKIFQSINQKEKVILMRIGLVIVTFRKSARSRMSEYEKLQKQNAGASSAWVNTVFPVHPSDADEAVDEVVGTDFSPSHAAVVMVSKATGCLDYDCLAVPGPGCGACSLNVSDSDPDPEFEQPEPKRSFRSWHAPQQQAH